jgi:hypothetical protein
VQSHIRDYNNIGPRFGVTWAPFKNGKTTFRGSAGIFYDWMNQNTLEQVTRVDGLHQQQVNIFSPAYPSPGAITSVLPADRYLFDSGLKLPMNTRFSGGVDQQLNARVRVNVLYQHWRTDDMWRGFNLNAPVNGVRPNPASANIIDVVPDAEFRAHQLTVGWNYGPPPQGFNNGGPLWDWKRVSLGGSFNYTHARDNTDGEFSIAPGALANEWARAGRDIPYRWNVNANLTMLRNLTAFLYWNLQSGNVYTERTGLDDNGDLIFNDRPSGVDRNTLRGTPQGGLNGQLAYSIPIRKRVGALPPGIQIQNNNGNLTVNQFAGDQARYRITIRFEFQNLTNHYNYTGYSGVLTSPFFGQATAVNNPRRIDLGIGFNF